MRFPRALPFLEWAPAALRDREGLRHDLAAGGISAVIVLPQALAFSRLAGMPPQAGLYTAIFLAAVAALFGSSRHLLSGPNTAMAMMIGVAMAPFAAAGSPEYLGYVAVLTLSVGALQLLLGAVRAGGILNFIPASAIEGITVAVAATLLLSQAMPIAGLTPVPGYPAWKETWVVLLGAHNLHLVSVALFAVTLAAGFLARRFGRGFVARAYLAVALIAGTAVSWLLGKLFGTGNLGVYLLGDAPIHLWPFAAPPVLDPLARSAMEHAVPDILALAFLGLLQTVVISRAAADESGQPVDINQDIRAQGLGNLAVACLGGFAGGGSFNRTKAHQEAGARTPLAAIFSAVILGALALAMPRAIAWIPYAVMAGVLVLVGVNLIDLRRIRVLLEDREQQVIFLVVALSGVVISLTFAVFVGLAIPVALYLRHMAHPVLRLEEREGETHAHLDGALFFGSVPAVVRLLRAQGERSGFRDTLHLHLEDIAYLDGDGQRMLREEAHRWDAAGGRLLITGRE